MFVANRNIKLFPETLKGFERKINKVKVRFMKKYPKLYQVIAILRMKQCSLLLFKLKNWLENRSQPIFYGMTGISHKKNTLPNYYNFSLMFLRDAKILLFIENRVQRKIQFNYLTKI